ncbi:MAG TPA: 50S ribosomal protein L30 [Anaerolineales bacterium]|nr:50S ribosomal protein L30 [Anaerolineales bacterium]
MPAKSKILRLKLVKSPIGYSKRQKATLQALGLRRMNQTVEHDDTPQIRGMLDRVSHLVEVVE